MVSTLDSHPADRGSIPHIYLNFFLFFLVILLRKYSLIIQKVQNSTQKLFVQFHYFKLFMYVYITYNEKKESKVLGHLLLITIIFWTVCPQDIFFLRKTKQRGGVGNIEGGPIKIWNGSKVLWLWGYSHTILFLNGVSSQDHKVSFWRSGISGAQVCIKMTEILFFFK